MTTYEVKGKIPGTDFFDKHPEEFEKILSDETFELQIEEDWHLFVGKEDECRGRYKTDNKHGWESFGLWCKMEITEIYGETMNYEHLFKSFKDKVKTLQLIINTVEGDFSQLSEELADIAIFQDEQFPKEIEILECGLKVSYILNGSIYTQDIQQDSKGHAYFRYWNNETHKQQEFYLNAITENN